MERSPESLQDHELLEILLFNVIPRKNTNGIAHDLLTAFGSLYGVLHADVTQLLTVNGVGRETANYLRVVGLVYERAGEPQQNANQRFNFAYFSQFLAEHFKQYAEEVLEIYCLDGSERIKASRQFTTGESSRVQVSVSDLAEFFRDLKPRAVVVAHNHLRASCLPSPADEDFTVQVAMACSVNGVKLYDHIIVGQDGVYSYFRAGRMERICKAYNVNTLKAKPEA